MQKFFNINFVALQFNLRRPLKHIHIWFKIQYTGIIILYTAWTFLSGVEIDPRASGYISLCFPYTYDTIRDLYDEPVIYYLGSLLYLKIDTTEVKNIDDNDSDTYIPAFGDRVNPRSLCQTME